MPVVIDQYAGVKTLTVVPENAERGLPVIAGLFTLFDFVTGAPVATMDVSSLTAVRTAAVSAAASSILSRTNSTRVTMLGAGHLAPFLAAAHAAVRPIRHVTFWARRPSQAASAANRLQAIRPDLTISFTEDLEYAVRSADIVSAATRATAPVIQGAWLAPGTHLDLVGGYRPDMREIDDVGIVRSELYVDSRMAALSEAGDIIDPLQRSVIDTSHIKGELADLATGAARRGSDEDITLFKSVGTAMADLAAAIGIWEAYDARRNSD